MVVQVSEAPGLSVAGWVGVHTSEPTVGSVTRTPVRVVTSERMRFRTSSDTFWTE